MKTFRAFIAVRKATDDGHEWGDMGTITGLMETTADKARHTDALIPHWGAANPVIDVRECTITY